MLQSLKGRRCRNIGARSSQPSSKSNRAKSRDALESLVERITRVEDGINNVEAHFEGIDQRGDGLEEELFELSLAVKESFTRLESSCKGELDELRSLFEEEMGRMKAAHER